jgi:predicted acylesterase/phospholipase RssA
MNYLIFLYQWVLKRLPRAFSIPMVILLVIYFAFAFPLLALHAVPKAESCIAEKVPDYSIPFRSALGIPERYSVVGGIVSAALIIAVALIGILLSYGIAGIIYPFLRGRPMKLLTLHDPSPLPSTPRAQVNGTNPLAGYERIGIILAGGGAKGAYQAGSMQAIYEFLEKHQALHKVRMIAGTSIGSWNSLFWLAGMVRRPDEKTHSVLEQWWHQVDVKSVIRPVLYVPLRQNYLLSAQPWEETFTRFFKENRKANELLSHHINHYDPTGDHNNCDQAIHFYLTRSNVAQGRLEFTTNRDDLSDVQRNLPSGLRPRQLATPDVWKAASSVEDLHDAVFASMDLPPLFRNSLIDDELFEDGGVVDNLPIKFGTEFEDCDLLFILPLNASFDQKPDQRSIVKRLFRVMDVRQGVLERNSFKMIYLYNELAALRGQTEGYIDALANIRLELASLRETDANIASLADRVETALESGPTGNDGQKVKGARAGAKGATDETEEGSAINRALHRRHKMVQVFSICPAPELEINTAEFWKTEEAGKAFRLMRKYTRYELETFFYRDTPAPDWIRMARVGPEGEVTYLTDF